ncbi:hypothetical protein ANN_17082, partial [Periplaneta americana]
QKPTLLHGSQIWILKEKCQTEAAEMRLMRSLLRLTLTNKGFLREEDKVVGLDRGIVLRRLENPMSGSTTRNVWRPFAYPVYFTGDSRSRKMSKEMDSCSVGQLTGDSCHKLTYTQSIALLDVKTLPDQDRQLLWCRLRKPKNIETVCYHHLKIYCSDKYTHLFGRKCCDPYRRHKTVIKKGLRQITEDLRKLAQASSAIKGRLEKALQVTLDSSSNNSENDLVALGRDYKDLLDCVKSSLQTALTVQEKMRLVSVAPRSGSLKKVAENLEYQSVRKARSRGLFFDITKKTGHPVPENVKTAVVEFYEDDDYSRNGIFFATSHGKSPCDAIGGTTKRLATKASLQRPYMDQILSARNLYKFANEHIPGVKYFYVSKEDIRLTEVELMERFNNSVRIPGTRENHSYVPLDDRHLRVSRVSVSCKFVDISVIKEA